MPTLHSLETRRQVYLQRYQAALADELAVYLARIRRAVVAELQALEVDEMAEVRLRRLVRRINKAQMPVWRELRAYLVAQYEELAADESEFEAQALEQATPAQELATVAGAVILLAAMGSIMTATGDTLEDFVDGYIQNNSRRVVQVVKQGYAKGSTINETIRDLTGTKTKKHKDGLFHRIRNNTQAVSGTGAQHVASTATKRTWQANAKKLATAVGIAEKKVASAQFDLRYYWDSVLDSRTTIICRSLSGNVFTLGQGPLPPAHVNCRSVVQLFDGTYPPNYQSYYDWLAEQPREFIEDAIGPKRAQLFLEGGLTKEQFARLNLGRNFHPLTLKEMRAKRPNAFKEAGL